MSFLKGTWTTPQLRDFRSMNQFRFRKWIEGMKFTSKIQARFLYCGPIVFPFTYVKQPISRLPSISLLGTSSSNQHCHRPLRSKFMIIIQTLWLIIAPTLSLTVKNSHLALLLREFISMATFSRPSSAIRDATTEVFKGALFLNPLHFSMF